MEGDSKVLYFKEQLNSVFKGIVYPEYKILFILFCKTTHFSTLVKINIFEIHLFHAKYTTNTYLCT